MDPQVGGVCSLDEPNHCPPLQVRVVDDSDDMTHLESAAFLETDRDSARLWSEHTATSNLSQRSCSTLATSISDASDLDDAGSTGAAWSNETSATTAEQSLNRQIRRELVHSTWPNQEFLPNDKAGLLLTQKNILRELARPHHGHDNRLLSNMPDVYGPPGRRKLFAILAMLNKGPAIFDLIQEGIHDGDLPFVFDVHVEKHLSRRTGEGRLEPIRTFQDEDEWPRHFLDMFESYQWKLLSPYFRLGCPENPKVDDHSLPDKTILPFIQYEQPDNSRSAGIYCGGSAEVRKVKIHQAHHNYHQMRVSPTIATLRPILSDE
jgi:hypothetical protein